MKDKFLIFWICFVCWTDIIEFRGWLEMCKNCLGSEKLYFHLYLVVIILLTLHKQESLADNRLST